MLRNLLQIANPLSSRIRDKISWYEEAGRRKSDILTNYTRSVPDIAAIAMEFLLQMRLHRIIRVHNLSDGKRVQANARSESGHIQSGIPAGGSSSAGHLIPERVHYHGSKKRTPECSHDHDAYLLNSRYCGPSLFGSSRSLFFPNCLCSSGQEKLKPLRPIICLLLGHTGHCTFLTGFTDFWQKGTMR